MQTVYGVAASGDGSAGTTIAIQGKDRPELRFTGWASPVSEFKSVQPHEIPILLDHIGGPVGRIIYLERRHQNLWAVGEVNDRVVSALSVRVGGETHAVPVPLYWSISRRGTDDYKELQLEEISLTTSPARVSATPVTLLAGGGLDHRAAVDRWRFENPFERQLLQRASVWHLDRRAGGTSPLVIQGDNNTRQPTLEVRRANPVEIRAATALDVHQAARELDVLIAPAETPTVIHERGRTFVEMFAHGCFSSVENAAQRITVNLAHERSRVIGKAVSFDAWDEQGLVGTLRLARTPSADEALALASEDCLGISAGFTVDAEGDEWSSDRSQRRIKRADLHHIALVDEAAHPSARVLAARSTLDR